MDDDNPQGGETLTLEQVGSKLEAAVKDVQIHVDERLDALAEKQKADAETLGQRISDEVNAVAEANRKAAGQFGYAPPADPNDPARANLSKMILGHLAGWDDASKSSYKLEYDLAHDMQSWVSSKAAQQSGIGSLGGLTIMTEVFPGIMEALRPASVFQEAMRAGGAANNILENLVGGPLSFDRGEGGITAFRKGESKPLTPTTETFSEMELRPRQLTALTKTSKLQLKQDAGAMGRYLEGRLGQELAIRADRDAFLGEAGEEPVGVLNASAPASASTDMTGVVYSGAAQTISDLLEDFKTSLKGRDAWGKWGEVMWFSTPEGFSRIRKSKDADGKPLGMFDRPFGSAVNGVATDDRLMGLRYAESTQLTFGGTNDHLLLMPVGAAYWAMWGAIELLPNELSDTAYLNNDLQLRAVAYQDSAIIRGALLQRAANWGTP